MKKSTSLLVWVVAILGLLTGFYLYSKRSGQTRVEAERQFAVKDTDQIYRIFLADRGGTSADLVRKGDHWWYNGKYKARPNAVDNLLETIRRVEVRYRPAKALEAQMIQDLGTNGIKVEIFGRNGQKIKGYYVGGVTPDETGTYMIMEDQEQPFVTHMPGFQGALRVRYLIKERDWRDRTVFSVSIDDIDAVSIEYPLQKNKSFRIERSGKVWKVIPFYDITPVIRRPLQKGYVEGFLAGFENLVAESFENESPVRDSVTAMVPFCIVTLKKKDGSESWARFHPFEFGGAANREGQDFTLAGGTYKSIERYLAELHTGDFMLLQHRVFQKIFWAYPSFFEAPADNG